MAMPKNPTKAHPFRIFFISGLVTILSLAYVAGFIGVEALLVATVLILVEIVFSFENAIINAKVLAGVSPFWRRIFLTIGILIAVFGMRLIFPILIVAITTGLPFAQVVDLAANNPKAYSLALNDSHISIAAFGGMFLTMLCLHFFFDKNRKERWISVIEKPLQDMSKWWLYTAVSVFILVVLSLLPSNKEPENTAVYGAVGIITYLVVHGLAELFARQQERKNGATAVLKTGMAGFMAFMYLEVLDASFSFDSVIGAFAVTQNVLLIAIGLGVGALWVRSITIYMVDHHILKAYRYLEHGAHYTIGVLASVLLIGIFYDVPEVIAGVIGLFIVGMAVVSSVKAARTETHSTT
jgi:uncharacterized protein